MAVLTTYFSLIFGLLAGGHFGLIVGRHFGALASIAGCVLGLTVGFLAVTFAVIFLVMLPQHINQVHHGRAKRSRRYVAWCWSDPI